MARRRLRALALLAAPSLAAAPPATIDGVWRIARPQTAFRPADGTAIPFTAEGRRRTAANRAAAAKGDTRFDPSATRCASPGQPRLALTGEPFAIFVRPRLVTIQYAWNRLFRQISVGKPYVSPALGEGWWTFGLMQGYATAGWQGATLVVRTDSFLDAKLIDAFVPNSDRLALTERLRLRDPDTLEDRITITDPVMFTRPWDAVVTYTRLPDAALPFAEDVCLDRLAAHRRGLAR